LPDANKKRTVKKKENKIGWEVHKMEQILGGSVILED
jgi:hypothetical protein